MRLLDVPDNAIIQIRREAVRKKPHIVDWYFCQRIEQATTHLLQNALCDY